MSVRQSQSSAAKSPDSPRPTAFFLAVLFAAGVSTWHWYRPLPKQAADVAGGSAFVAQSQVEQRREFSRAQSRWEDSGLVFPSEESASQEPDASQINRSIGSLASEQQASLVGSRDLALQPFRESSIPLRESFAAAPLPMVPVPANASATSTFPSQARLWAAVAPSTDPERPIPTKQDSVDSTEQHAIGLTVSSVVGHSPNFDTPSPFRVPHVDGPRPSQEKTPSLKTDVWPDQGFQPSSDPMSEVASRKPPSEFTAGFHAVSGTHTSHGTGAAGNRAAGNGTSGTRIRTLDSEFESQISLPSASLRPNGASETRSNDSGPAPLRPRSPIRQPANKNAITK